MYESFYKLNKLPFDLLPDSDFHFMSDSHSMAYTNLQHAISETKEFVAITGENGFGKTILLNHFLNNIKEKVRVAHISNADAPIDNFTKLTCQKFDLDVEGKSSMGMLDFFHAFLLKQYEIDERVVIVIDDAHNLKPEAMEELWMLSNLESESFHLIQVILAGKPEFEYLLRRKDLQQFAQRITMRCHLGGLSMAETGQYIRHRLDVAGTTDLDIFDEDAIKAIYENSNGNPHLVNILCDTALVSGFADNQEHISKAFIENLANEKKEEILPPDSEKDNVVEFPSQPAKASTSAPPATLPSNIEERLSKLETLAENIDNKLEMLIKRKGGQDRTVIELNKMLMESLKRHGNTLKQFRSFKEKIRTETKSSKKTKQSNTPRSGDPLKKKKKTPQKRTTPKSEATQ